MRLAARSEIVYAVLTGVLALGIVARSSAGEGDTLFTLVAQVGLASLAASGLLHQKRWGWVVAVGLLAMVFGPIAVGAYQAWRAHAGLAIPLAAGSVVLTMLTWLAQLTVAVCFILARGWRPPEVMTP